MRIDLGGGDRAVAQQGLDVADVHPGLQKQGGEGVAEHVRGHMGGDVNHPQVTDDDPPDRLGGEGAAPAVIQDPALSADLF